MCKIVDEDPGKNCANGLMVGVRTDRNPRVIKIKFVAQIAIHTMPNVQQLKNKNCEKNKKK